MDPTNPPSQPVLSPISMADCVTPNVPWSVDYLAVWVNFMTDGNFMYIWLGYGNFVSFGSRGYAQWIALAIAHRSGVMNVISNALGGSGSLSRYVYKFIYLAKPPWLLSLS